MSDHDKRREYISGFSGSNGDAIVTFEKAALWTDGRYHLQADDQLDCHWLLMKHGRSDVPSQAEWLKDNLKKGARIGADPKLIPNTLWTSLQYELENNSMHLIKVNNNLVDLIWLENRPPPSNKIAYVWDIKYAGKGNEFFFVNEIPQIKIFFRLIYVLFFIFILKIHFPFFKLKFLHFTSD